MFVPIRKAGSAVISPIRRAGNSIISPIRRAGSSVISPIRRAGRRVTDNRSSFCNFLIYTVFLILFLGLAFLWSTNLSRTLTQTPFEANVTSEAPPPPPLKNESLPAGAVNVTEPKLGQVTAGTSETSAAPDLPLIILITPTFSRPGQALHISQTVNVLRLVPPPLLWIVIESLVTSKETARLLNRTAGKCLQIGIQHECSKINYTHIASNVHHEDHSQSRGVNQRNRALEYVEQNRLNGIIYFMDDDNNYTPELFQEIRKVKRVGVWPVGFLWTGEFQKVTGLKFTPLIERPLVNVLKTGESVVVGWETFQWAASMEPSKMRKYQTDMAGFAFASSLLWEPTDNVTERPKHPIRFESKPMYIESLFLNRLVRGLRYLEPLANNCEEVYVWHTRLESEYQDPYPTDWRIPQPTDLVEDTHLNHTARYVIKKKRYYVLGHNKSLPFGYKRQW